MVAPRGHAHAAARVRGRPRGGRRRRGPVRRRHRPGDARRARRDAPHAPRRALSRLRRLRVEAGVLRRRHRPLRGHVASSPAGSTSRSCRSPVGARRSAPGTSTPSAPPKPCSCSGRGSQFRSTGGRCRCRASRFRTSRPRGSGAWQPSVAPDVEVQVLQPGAALTF